VSAPPKVVFVLPAGGSAGAAQVGVAQALLEAGVRPDALVGCSVGALNAAFLAVDPTPARAGELATVWRSVTRADVFGASRSRLVLRAALRQEHLYDPFPLRSLIARFCPLDDLAEAAVPVHVVTTDLDLGVARWWRRGPASDLLYATACLPGLLPPVVLDGHRHVDGGVLEPVPVQRAVDLDAETVYVLGDPFELGPSPARMSALGVLLRCFSISRYTRLPDPSRQPRAGQRVVVVPGASTTGVDIRDFSQTDALIRDSHRIARHFLAGLQADVEPAVPAAHP
jgi:NTE family protein